MRKPPSRSRFPGLSAGAQAESLTSVNTTDSLPVVNKRQFGDLLRRAREEKDYSLRQLAGRVGIDYSRLAKIELGTRPAPGLSEVRRLADVLELDMVDLLVAAGTSREVMEHLLWSERLHHDQATTKDRSYLPERSPLLAKNTYCVRVLKRDGALCTVGIGEVTLRVFHFGRSREITISIAPETVLVLRDGPDLRCCAVENVLTARVKKIRHLGQITNLVLSGGGLEINSLHGREAAERLGLSVGDPVVVVIPAAAIRTSSIEAPG